MHVTLMRHYKVNHSWKNRYTPEEFRNAQREYDEAEVIDQGIRIRNHFQRVIISGLKRTALTLQHSIGKCEYLRTDLLNEVPIQPFTDKQKTYSVATLMVMARIQWLFNSKRQPETRKGSTRRVRKFIEEFLTQEGNYLVIGHGFFLRLLSRELLKRGFKGKAINYMRNGEQVCYEL